MARDPLPVLLRLRCLTLDAARRDLAARLREAAAAEARADALARTIVEELGRQRALAAAGPGADVASAWLADALTAQQDARDAVAASGVAAVAARTNVSAARAAKRAVELALETGMQAREEAAVRQEQHVLDEAAARRARSGRWSG